MEWTNATALKFIETYGKYPCLWDPTNPERSSRFRRAEAWHMVKKELGDVYTVEELRRKKESLMTMYRLTKSKVMRSDPEAGYEPTWFAYSAMDAFLGWVYDTCPTPSMKMENNGYVSANSDCYYREESAESKYCDPAIDVKNEVNSIPNGTEVEHNLAEEGSSQSTMNWSNEYTIKFLKLYRRNSCLWDPSNPDNALVQCRTKAWNAIKKELKTPCTIEELKKKKEILIGTYRRFKRKEMKYNSSFYAPDWFAYSLIDSFLAPVYKSSKAFVLRNEKKDRNVTYSSSEEEDVKRNKNFVDVLPLKDDHSLELQTEQANRDISNYQNISQNDSEDDQEPTAQSIETQIDWSGENVLKFLKIFRKHPCLWDPANPRRKNIRHRNRAWLAIKKELGDQYTTEELKKKKEILMCAYRRCRRNIIKWKSTGGVYRPSWFAFPVMDSFLRSTTKCHEASVSAENVESSTELSSEEDTDINNSVNDTQNDTEFKIDWTQEDIINFIELFQSFPCLWNPADPEYACRRRRNQNWSKIKKKLGDRFTINELRRRKDMLLCTYRRCKKTAVEVESKNCVYEPTWFAFSLMDSFLNSIDKCPVTFIRTESTEDTDHNASNSCYNDEDVKRNQKLYSSLPMTSEDPLELVTVVANSDQSNYEDDAQNNSEDEQDPSASGPESQMDWTNEKALKFLELYKKNPCLWDPTNQERTNKDYVAKTWLAVKSEMGDRCTVEELKKKKDSLLAMYRRCRKRMKETESEPTWFAFSLIDGFLGSIYKCPDPQNSAKTEDYKHHKRADSSYNRVEMNDWNVKSEPGEGKKEDDYMNIVFKQWKENPLDLQVDQEDTVENNFERDEHSDPEQEAIADCSQTINSFCTNEEVLKFIQLYKGHPVLWDPTNIQRRSKPRVADAWNAIKRDLGDRYTVGDLKRKKESLMTTYRTIKKRVMDLAASDDSEPVWFAFAVMDEFLAPIYKNSTLSNTKYADHQSFADSSYYPDESNESIAYSEPETKCDNYVSIVSTSAIKRRNPLKMPGMAKKIKREEHIIEEDECSLFGKLVTSKLRKVPQDRRDWLMLKINELFYNDTKGNRD